VGKYPNYGYCRCQTTRVKKLLLQTIRPNNVQNVLHKLLHYSAHLKIASSPLVEGLQSTYSHPPPMDERLNLGSNESDSTSNETYVASRSNDNDVKLILNLDGQGYIY